MQPVVSSDFQMVKRGEKFNAVFVRTKMAGLKVGFLLTLDLHICLFSFLGGHELYFHWHTVYNE